MRNPSPVTESLPGDVFLLFAARILRLFAYGFLSVVLVLHLAAAGLSESQIGLLLTFTLVGDTVMSLWITTSTDRVGRKRMLLIGAVLMIFAGVVFAGSHSFVPLLIAATVGVISPSGNEVGPFLAIEQASLAEEVVASHRRLRPVQSGRILRDRARLARGRRVGSVTPRPRLGSAG
jgi:MFS family permease